MGSFEIAGVIFTHEYVQRFWAKSQPDPESECVLWTAATDPKGYGICRGPLTKSGICKAHRISYWLVRGPILDDGDHQCRNTSCVNPYHLREMSRSMNTALGTMDRGSIEADEEGVLILDDLGFE